MNSFLKVVLWFPITLLTLILTFSLYLPLANPHNQSGLVRQQIDDSKSKSLSFALIPKIAIEIKTSLAKEDARPLLIDKYLSHYSSPMAGMGDYIVKVSDRFNLDPYLVVAIAQQESNLGKLMPPNCHNAWGWGIHSAGTLCFDSWNEGINTFISGLSEKYLAYGLNTPEAIMTKYNPTSPGGAWAKGVNQFLTELQTGSW